jgi:D-cysteine desulfhydrase family pyridoxal phosphate-dependent enzyme
MKELPRLKIAHLPTPVESLPRLTAELGGPNIWVKRDDQTGLAFGGNKTRKLEFLAADALEKGARMLITAGAIQSNHCRQTAAVASRLGLDCILVLTGDPTGEYSGNLFLDRLLGAELVWTTRPGREEKLREVFSESEKAGRQPYLIPFGGSNPLGAVGYAFAMRELDNQNIQPQWIVFASASGGTQAGLVVGAYLSGFQGKILGISVDEPAAILQERVASLARETVQLVGESISGQESEFSISPGDIHVNDNYIGAGYGVMGEAEIEAVRLFARKEGLILDPVYTGRAAAGLIDLVRNGFFPREADVLFWHTGGTPAMFADRYRRLASEI